MIEITHARVLRIALPIVISNATVPLLGAVDTAVVGQMGLAAPIGAVGLGAVVLATVYWIFGFLRMGTSGLAAQAQGAGDMPERTAILLRALLVGVIAGVGLIALQGGLFWAAFRVAPASAEVEGLMRAYLGIRIWGAPATISLYAITGWLVAVARTRGVMVLQVGMNALNVGLSMWFVLGLHWGVPGVATATLIAEWCGLALGLWLCRDAFGRVFGQAWARLGNRAALAVMMVVNRDIMVRSVILQLSFTTFLFLGAGYGDVTLAANQVLLQFLEVTAFALDGFAFAAEGLVGQAVGAGLVAQVRRASVVTMQWGVVGAVLMAAVFAVAGTAIIDVMTTSSEVRGVARGYLPWMVMAPVVGVASWVFDGIFIGATLTGLMMRTMLVSVGCYVVALFVLVPGLGNHGLWGSLMVLNIARAVTMGWVYGAVERKAGMVGANPP
jgi:multidrug resistance protein, MATE family